MIPQAQMVWSGLGFRGPMMFRNVEPLSEEQMHWVPGPGRNSIAWQLWHIAEVEDNWVRRLILNQPAEFPFGVQMREAPRGQYPGKAQLLEYFNRVRSLSRQRLDAATDAEFERLVDDDDFGRCSVRDIWMGVVTSFAWHSGQIALTAKLLPESPVKPMQFKYWKPGEGKLAP